MKLLGYMNGWRGEIPYELHKCREAGHVREEVEIYKNVTQYTCKICEIQYCVDHGD
jgi:hypothetical protein